MARKVETVVKRCTYCGKEYPDEANSCSLDNQPLASSAPSSAPSDLPQQHMLAPKRKLPLFALGFVLLITVAAAIKILILNHSEDKATQASPATTDNYAESPAIFTSPHHEDESAAQSMLSESEETLAIKGLRMGMDKRDARSALNKLGFPSVFTDFDPHSFGVFSNDVTADRVATNRGNMVLVYGSDQKLIHVEMWGGMANWLFNVGDMSVKEFAQMFVIEYKLGEMEPFSRGNIAGWKYRDEKNGVELVIYTGSSADKKITFHSIPKLMERKFD